MEWMQPDSQHFKSALHCCREKLPGTKIHFFNVYGNDYEKKIYIFLFPRCVEEYIFAGLVYFIVALSSQNLKSSI